MALGPGSIAFVGINSAATQGDWLAFVVLQDIPAGTTIYLTDNELTSATSGTFNSGESFSKWVAPSAGVTAGTVVTITAFDTTAPLASLGAASPVTVANSANRGLATGSDVVYAYLADAATPSVPTTFLAYVNLGSAVDGVAPSTLSGGAAVSVTTGQDGMVYAGPTTGLADFAAYAAAIGDTANWTKVAAGVAPTQVVSGFSTSLTYAAQTVAFSAASVSVAEGDAGTTTVTFTVTRAGGTDGEVSFDGSFVPGTGLDGADFAAGVIPTAFSGTIAAGAASATVTVAIAGDVVVEDNETFTLTLTAATNAIAAVPLSLGATTVATGTVQNDDAEAGNVVGGIEILDVAASLAGSVTTPVATGDVGLVRLGAFDPAGTPSQANAEVVAWSAVNHSMYVLNTLGAKIDIVQVGADGALTLTSSIDLSTLPGFVGANSVAVKGSIVAVAYGAAGSAPGAVALYDLAGTLSATIAVGVGPDQLTFTPDGARILVANEAEAVSTTDNAAGSVSIIDVATATVVNTISFASLNGNEAVLRSLGLALIDGQTAAADIEPEYITVSPDGTTAYVTLQEVDAVAVIDLTDAAADRPVSILPLGGVDHALVGNEFDASDKDGIDLATADVVSLLQPDAIASFSVGGVTYFITANEGDGRVGTGIEDTDVVKLSTLTLDPTVYPDAAALKATTALGNLKVLTGVGDIDRDGDIDQITAIGGRGISIFQQNADGTIVKVRETGGEFEKIIAALPNAATVFNGQNGGSFDSRSDDKGPEPEGVTIGVIGERTYAFVALERVGGIMTWDVTDPANAFYVGYTAPTATDYGPEVVTFVKAEDSPTGTALVLSANEVSGTTTVYAALGEAQSQTVAFQAGSLAVSHDEGTGGTTTYTFTVERAGGTIGALDFTAALASTTATTADFDGVAALPATVSGTIAAGATTATVTVTVAADAVKEATESFSLTLASATNSLAGVAASVAATNATATGTIVDDDYLHIWEIQGTGHVSAMVDQAVVTRGVVTAIDTNGSKGFWIQDVTGDGNAATSDGVFVFTSSTPTVAVGQLVQVSGTVKEYTPSGAANGYLSLTEITSPTVVTLGTGYSVTPVVIGGADGLLPPTEDLAAGTAFFESLEGMMVTVVDAQVVGATNSYGEIYTVVDDGNAANGASATGLTDRGGITVTGGTGGLGVTNTVGGDFNPERIQIDDDSGVLAGFVTPAADVGAVLADVTGVMTYDFGNYQVTATRAYAVAQASTIARETTSLAGDATHLLVASYNCENLDPTDGSARFATIAAQIIGNLGQPDIVALQEIQDNDGATNSSTTSASTTLSMLVAALNAASGSTVWASVDNPFIGDDSNGGEPGGNIRNAYVYRTDRVDFVEGSLATIAADGSAITSGIAADQVSNVDNPFYGSRLPLVATFTFAGQDITLIDIHSTSKGGSGTLMGSVTPALNTGEVQRAAQAQAINTYVDGLLATDSAARVMVLGDANEFGFEEPMSVMAGTGTLTGYDVAGTDTALATGTYTSGGDAVLFDLQASLPAGEHYDYVFEGNSETLDHVLATRTAAENAQFDVVRINSEFASQTSDHDPLVARIDMTETPDYTLQILHGSDFEAGIKAVTRAGNFAAIVDYLEDTVANSITLAGGDNYLPGPFFNAGSDPSVKEALETALETHYHLASGSLNLSPSVGRADIAMLDIIGVQASAVGNHEYDAGTKEMQNILAKSSSWVGPQFPYLSANTDFSGDANLAGLYTASILDASAYSTLTGGTATKKIAPATVITENGEKIGVVGCTTQIVESISSTGGIDIIGDDVNDMVALAAILQPTIDALIAQGIDKVILLSHLQQIAFEKQLATLLRGVDIIVAAGSHTRMVDATDTLRSGDAAQDSYPYVTNDADGNATVVVSTDGEYSYVGRLVVGFDADGHIMTDTIEDTVSGAFVTTDAAVQDLYANPLDVDGDGTADAAFEAGSRGDLVNDIAQAVGSVISAQDGAIFGKTSVYLEGRRAEVRTEETNLGDLSADANLWYAQKTDATVLVSIKNGGGIRDSIGQVYAVGSDSLEMPTAENEAVGKEAGEVSQLDILNSLRFNNALSMITLTAAQLLQVLEHGVKAVAPGATPGQFAQIGGVSFSYDPDLPAGDRVVSAALIDAAGEPTIVLVRDGVLVADAPAAIRVVTLSYLVTGGDNYPFKDFVTADPTFANVVNLGVANTTDPGLAGFAVAGSEQDAFAEYMAATFATRSFDLADTTQAGDTRIENLNARADDILAAAARSGGTGNDHLVGGKADDTIVAGEGNDILDGGKGNDVLSGGVGNDIYYLDNAGDRVIEAAGEGSDLVYVSFDYTLGADLEKLAFRGSDGHVGTGNDGANKLTGAAGDDVLNGLAGNDTITGGAGLDTLVGGIGDDVYIVADTGDVVTEDAAGGNDWVQASATFTLGDEVERLTLTGVAAIDGTGNAGANRLEGNAAANTLSGLDGNDILSGGGGADVLLGGAGNDTYYLGATAGAVVVEAVDEGRDSVSAGFTYTLTANVETLTLTGADAVDGTGNELANGLFGNAAANTLTGLAGNDTLDGGVGADTLVGGLGDDVYYVDDAGDVIVEVVGEGSDLVYVGFDWVLADNVEKVALTGAAAIDATGNAANNKLTGNAGANDLLGLAGNDTLSGGGGDDLLAGGVGADVLTGGAGADRFLFDAAPLATAIDRVSDFSHADGDRIVLDHLIFTGLATVDGHLDAAMFATAAPTTADQHVLWDATSGTLSWDADGSGATAAVKIATFTAGLTLAADDFLLA